MSDNKLNKYNIDFDNEAIHYFKSANCGVMIPIYLNLNYVDFFYNILASHLSQAILQKLLSEYCIPFNVNEINLLNQSIKNYLLISNKKVKNDLFNEFKINYTD